MSYLICQFNAGSSISLENCQTVYQCPDAYWTNRCKTVEPAKAQLSQNVDYAVLGQFWGIAFSSVLFLYVFSRGIGQVLKLVRNG